MLYEAQCAIPSPAWHEMVYGFQRLPDSRKKRVIQVFLFDYLQSKIPIVPYSKEAAEWHAMEKARLSAKGKTPPFIDGQIAAIAKVEGLTLVTDNQKDFETFDSIQMVNWKKGP